MSEEKCHCLWAVETFLSLWLVYTVCEIGNFILAHGSMQVFFSGSLACRFFSHCFPASVTPSHSPKNFLPFTARCTFGSNKCTWRKSVIQYRSWLHVYLLGGSKWLLANALISVALAECTLHGALLRSDLTSCVGRGGQEASRQHMQTDPCGGAQPGCS